ncbi:MAG: heme-binding domain-containing protein [Acidobacteriota bacterium]|nr:heme-binding domain-containing protein [Acidobacteriota bacterium]
MRSACDDYHSNRSVWPCYSRIAPISCLVSVTKRGRAYLSLSQMKPRHFRR